MRKRLKGHLKSTTLEQGEGVHLSIGIEHIDDILADLIRRWRRRAEIAFSFPTNPKAGKGGMRWLRDKKSGLSLSVIPAPARIQ